MGSVARCLTMGGLWLQLAARNLPSKDLGSKSDPFLVIFKLTSSGAFHFVSRTTAVKDDCSPVWEKLHFEEGDLGMGTPNTTIVKLEILDDDTKGAVEALAVGVYRLDQLERACQQGAELPFQNPRENCFLLVKGYGTEKETERKEERKFNQKEEDGEEETGIEEDKRVG